VLAVSAAAAAGAEEALFLNTSGRVACAATGNLFALNGTTLKTPPPEEGALAGAVRAEVLALANEVGLTPAEAPLTRDELTAADAVFTTSSLRLIAPIVALDGEKLATAGLVEIGRLARALSTRIQHRHGPCPWSVKGPSEWPTLD
jgi:branched-chain amino acid aminotransferase